jgi:tRNA (guanine-N7-)-methyltransferase
MPRGPHRRTDETPLCGTSYLARIEELSSDWKLADLFPHSQPLEVEVGSGKGLFIASACKQNPAHNFVGIEIIKKYAAMCALKLQAIEADNGRMLEGDGQKFLRERIGENALTAVHVYFPDPWWKRKHRKRRVLNPSFLREVERTLQPGGSLHVWTDVEEYFEATKKLVAQVTKLHGPLAVPERHPEHDLDYRTHFERRTRLNNAPVFRAEWCKAAIGD